MKNRTTLYLFSCRQEYGTIEQSSSKFNIIDSKVALDLNSVLYMNSYDIEGRREGRRRLKVGRLDNLAPVC